MKVIYVWFEFANVLNAYICASFYAWEFSGATCVLNLSVCVCKIKSVIYKSCLVATLHHMPDLSLSVQKRKPAPHTSYLTNNQRIKSCLRLVCVSLVKPLLLPSCFGNENNLTALGCIISHIM